MALMDQKYWRSLLDEVRNAKNTSLKKQKIVEDCANIISMGKVDSVIQCIATNILFTLDPEYRFDISEFRNVYFLSGKLNSISGDNKADMQFIFLELLNRIESLDVLCVHQLTAFLKNNIRSIINLFGDTVIRRVVNRLILLWHSNINLTVPNAITKSISNYLLLIFRQCNISILNMLNVFVYDLPYNAKFKYPFLDRLLREIRKEETNIDLLVHCYHQLERCLEEQCLCSVAVGCVTSIGKHFKDIGESEKFVDLLYGTITATNKFVQVNACRLWLPKVFFQIPDVAPLIYEKLTQKLSTSSSLEFLGINTSDWSQAEIIAYAWTSVIKSRKLINERNMSLLNLIIQSHRNEIKINTLNALNALRENGKLNEHSYRAYCSNFVSVYWNGEDDELCSEIMNVFNRLPEKLKLALINERLKSNIINGKFSRKLKVVLLRILNSNSDLVVEYLQNWKKSNLVDTATVMEFMASSLVDKNEQTNRQAAFNIFLNIIKNVDVLANVFSKEMLVDVLYNTLISSKKRIMVVNIANLLLYLGANLPPSYEQCNWDELMNADIGSRDFCRQLKRTPMFIAMTMLQYKHGHIEESQALEILERATSLLLRLGGSPSRDACLNVSQLNTRFADLIKLSTSSNAKGTRELDESWSSSSEDDEDDEDFFEENCSIWSREHRRILSSYSNSLIEICLTASGLAVDKRFSKPFINDKLLPLVLDVLLRTHHKGVVQKGANEFAIVLKAMVKAEEKGQEIVENILFEIITLLFERRRIDQLCKSRDLAFAEIFHSILTIFPNFIDQFVRTVISSLREMEKRASESDTELVDGVEMFPLIEIRIRVLFIMRRLLQSSVLGTSDLKPVYEEICRFLICGISTGTMDKDHWKCFSMYCSVFVAFTDAMFSGYSTYIPLMNFLNLNSQNRNVIEIIYEKLREIANNFVETKLRQPIKYLPVLLAPFERLVLLAFPFDTTENDLLTFVRKLLDSLAVLIRSQPSVIVRRQILNIVLNLIPYKVHRDLFGELKNISLTSTNSSNGKLLSHSLSLLSLEVVK